MAARFPPECAGERKNIRFIRGLYTREPRARREDIIEPGDEQKS